MKAALKTFGVGLFTTLVMLGLIVSLKFAWAQEGARSTQIRHTAVAMTGASVSVVVANPSRRYLRLENNDATAANVVFCRLDGATATVNTGVRLEATAAGTPRNAVVFDVLVPDGAINCISAAGTPLVLVTEGF